MSRQVHVINLDRSADRLGAFRSRNAHLATVSRFSAIDGATLDIGALISCGVIHENILTAYSRGALGCALSHAALWDSCIGSGQPITIAEDDAILNGRFDKAAEAALAALTGEWDMVLWGWNFSHLIFFDALPGVSRCIAHFDETAMRSGVAEFQRQRITPQLFRLLRAFGIVCYSLTPRGAAALKAACFPLRDGSVTFPDGPYRNTGIDIMMNGSYAAINAYVSLPPLVITPNDASTIQGQRPIK